MSDLLLALKRLFKVISTNRCQICGCVIELDEVLCDNCKKLKKIESPRCIHCGHNKKECNCKKHKKQYSGIVAPFYYSDTVVYGVHNFKDSSMLFLADSFAHYMLDVIKEEYSDINFDYITFVPMHPIKKMKRGFNQSELIARNISKALNVECLPLLYVNFTYYGTQHKRTAAQRKTAVYGAYDVKSKYLYSVKDKNILIIDDVKTTGSTLNECAKMLRLCGASKVYAASFAITKSKKPKKKDNS